MAYTGNTIRRYFVQSVNHTITVKLQMILDKYMMVHKTFFS